MPLRKVNQMTDADHELVSNAVSMAEKATCGEIVTIVTDYSDHYRDIAFLWATVAAFLLLSVVALIPDFYLSCLQWVAGGWDHEYSNSEYLTMILGLMSLKFLGVFLIMQWMPLRLLLTSKSIKEARVRARAINLFKVGAKGRTVDATAILIYLSMREHRAEIVADKSIAEKVAPEIWGDAMIGLIENVRAGKPGAGMAEAVRQIGIILAEHFPKGDDVVNELPDRLIEL